MFINSFGEEIITEKIYANTILEINLAGITNPNLSYRMAHNTNPSKMHYQYYVFEHVLEGKGYIETPKRTYTVCAGDLYFLNKGQYHIYYPDHRTPFKKEFIVIRGPLTDSLVSLFKIDSSVIVRHMDVSPLFHRIFENLKHQETLPNDELESLIFQLFQLIRTPDSGMEFKNDLAVLIMDYLYDHIQENLNMPRLSSDLNISESAAHHAFTKRYGTSPMKFFMSIKLDYAQQLLLLQSQEPVSAIARRLSFEDENYFSKCFKRKFGVTPSQFRKAPEVGQSREFRPRK